MSRVDDDVLPADADEQAAAWCMRMAEGSLTAEEQIAFDDWQAQADHREVFAEAVAVWQGLESVADQPELIRVRSQALESFRQANSRRWAKRLSDHWIRSASVAAALLLGILALLYGVLDRAQVYETGVGERRVVMLDDGSRLSLDAATRLEVTFTKERRKLQLLEGRAKFDVAKDPLRPFSVATGNKMVVAVGTSFSVERLQQQFHVILYEGRVTVLEQASALDEPQPMRLSGNVAVDDRTLTPGNELVAAEGPAAVTIRSTDVPRSLSWEAGQLNFVNEPLSSAVERMNRYSKEQLEVGDAQVATFNVNGVFTAGDIDAFVEGVTTFHRVDVLRGSGKRVLIAASAKKSAPTAVPQGR